MIDTVIHPDSKEEQKTNRNLAIWIGVGVMGMFALIYVLFFAVMLLQPGLIFRLMPMPTVIDKALSDGTRTYLLYQKVDMSTVNPRLRNEPRIDHFLSVLTGDKLGPQQKILPFTHASGGDNRLLFLGKGVYRIYENGRWTEERMATIGKDPTGILTPAGVYVLSGGASGPHLSLISGGTATDIPLPADFLAQHREKRCSCPCTRLAWYGGRLSLFWKNNDILSWTILDGNAWSQAVTSPLSGGYDVLADDGHLYLFMRDGDGPNSTISYSVFSGDAWSAPVTLPVKGGILNWDVFLQKGKPMLFIQHLTTQTVAAVELGRLVDPVRLKGPLGFPGMGIGWMALWIGGGNLISFLAIFVVSAVIRRFKKRVWREEGGSYEFASLFRRFAALTIDKLLLLIPPGIIVLRSMRGLDDFAGDPFRVFASIFSALALYFGGSFLYHSLLEGVYGQTVGKKVCGIRVVKADFSPCGLQAGFVRNILRIADGICGYLVAAISLAATFRWQRVGDLVAETVVVRKR